ncbi:MAG: amino acid adenylation domain-containing protein [Peptoniphilus sp.]|nr:amino acid adenylation domain-containing protein [Peptoniphilus sp.]MDD7362845.1 amino acid adenylation domain-containing protein [Bacillota bacterium]MDY6043963.1 amino acid adenylation domain-containing protein [Peptoniphilus sp.]
MLLTSKLDDLAETVPEKLALVDADRSVTFKELRDEALSLAAKIHNRYKKTNTPVLVEVNRKVETVICFMGVLYSGNFYVPVNHEEPASRIAEIAKQVEAEVGVFHDRNIFGDMIDIDFHDESMLKEEDSENAPSNQGVIDVDPCYVLFTSGSTGKPKGVVISHRMVLDFMDWILATLSIEDQRIANQTPFFFDASVKEIALMLGGATIYIMDKTLFMFPVKAVEFLNDHAINTILWSVSAVNIMANSKVFEEVYPEHLKIVAFAGEALPASKLNYWRKFVDARYFNLYGPTEATVDACYYEVDRDFDDADIIPIGRACDNMELLILDGDEVADEGELVIRGGAVSYGYYNDCDKTKAAFVQNPLNTAYPETVYRTGDRVRRNAYGEIEFLARKDHQIKLHGYRIELGEVEMAMASLDIEDVVCLYDDASEIIVAIYSGREFSKGEFKKALRKIIPTYMIPSRFIRLESLPRTQNTKIDRKKLRERYVDGEL